MLEQMNAIDICKTFHSKTAEYTFFSSARGTSFWLDHRTLCQKTSLNKLKRIEMIPHIFSDHNSMNPKINYKKKTGKQRRLSSMLLINQCISEENKEEIKKQLKRNKVRNTTLQNL